MPLAVEIGYQMSNENQKKKERHQLIYEASSS